MRNFFAAIFLASCVNAQSFQHNDITFSGGESWVLSKRFAYSNTAVSLGATYGYRINRFIEPEAGLFGAINPVPPNCESYGCYNGDNRFFWVPFGVRFILPLKQDRYELSAGGGGLYESFSVSNLVPESGLAPYSGFGGYFKASAAVALDRRRHFWLSATPRSLLANPAYERDRWLMMTGDLSFRF